MTTKPRKLTAAQTRVLQAMSDGKVLRIHTSKLGDVLAALQRDGDVFWTNTNLRTAQALVKVEPPVVKLVKDVTERGFRFRTYALMSDPRAAIAAPDNVASADAGDRESAGEGSVTVGEFASNAEFFHKAITAGSVQITDNDSDHAVIRGHTGKSMRKWFDNNGKTFYELETDIGNFYYAETDLLNVTPLSPVPPQPPGDHDTAYADDGTLAVAAGYVADMEARVVAQITEKAVASLDDPMFREYHAMLTMLQERTRERDDHAGILWDLVNALDTRKAENAPVWFMEYADAVLTKWREQNKDK